MAKSLRSKTKRAFRKIKREDPKSDYHIRDKLRLQRLNEKLKVLTPVSDDDDEDDVEDETVAQPAASSSMQEDSSNSKQGDSQHRVHDGCSDGDDTLQQQHDTSMTQLCWILGMLDADTITLACSDNQHVASELCQRCDCAGVVELLQYLCTTCWPYFESSQLGDSKAGPSTSTSTSTMQTEETEPPKKISTGGPRQSANLEWRKKVGMGPKKRTSANSTTFTKPKNYKSPGRARRARN